MKDVHATVAYKEFAGEKYFRLGLKVGWDEFHPGQFVMVQVPGGEVLLRRPFGIVKTEGGVLEVCVKIVGKGTRALSQISPGQSAQVLGPLGRGFTIPKDAKTAVLIAGGYGIAPLLPLAHKFKDENKKIVFYYGAKKSPDLLYINEFKTMGIDLRIATEDGSAGEKGLVTERAAREADKFEGATIFACGPEGLLKEIAKMSSQLKVPAQVSLERYMACGVGVCLGCVVKSRDGSYVRACREGPVFNAEDVEWNAEKT